MTSTNINIRTDVLTKKKAEKLFDKLGLNMTTAINMFLKQSIIEDGIPFVPSLSIPNSTTLKALKEAEKMSKHPNKYKSYTNANDLIKDCLNGKNK